MLMFLAEVEWGSVLSSCFNSHLLNGIQENSVVEKQIFNIDENDLFNKAISEWTDIR